MPLPLILGGAALLGGGIGGARLLKDELNFTAEDAANEELLQQGTRKGFNAKEGVINRGLFESLRDKAMGNSPEDILKATQAKHLKNLTESKEGQALSDSRPDYQITNRMTQQEVDKKYRETQRRDPVITQIKATGELGDKYSMKDLQSMDQDSLYSVLKEAKVKERITDDSTNPITQRNESRYIDSKNLQSMMLGHQMQQSNNQFALQQSQLQLQNRREDAREARGERKDRQMMIMQMMKGLSQMGASLAI